MPFKKKVKEMTKLEAKKGEELAEGEVVVSEEEATETMVDIIATGVFTLCSRLGFGGVMGFAAGYAVKQAAKVALAVTGAAFIGLQGLAYCGYISVNWKKVKQDAVSVIDTDGSGKLTVKDVKYYVKKTFGILSFGGAGATGLSAGLYMGLRN